MAVREEELHPDKGRRQVTEERTFVKKNRVLCVENSSRSSLFFRNGLNQALSRCVTCHQKRWCEKTSHTQRHHHASRTPAAPAAAAATVMTCDPPSHVDHLHALILLPSPPSALLLIVLLLPSCSSSCQLLPPLVPLRKLIMVPSVRCLLPCASLL